MAIVKKTDGESTSYTVTGADLVALKDDLTVAAFGEAHTEAGHCRNCKEPFSDKNVFSAAGWRDTEIIQMCERCYDAMFEEYPE